MSDETKNGRADGPQNMAGQRSGEQNLAGAGQKPATDQAQAKAGAGSSGKQGPVEDVENPTPS